MPFDVNQHKCSDGKLHLGIFLTTYKTQIQSIVAYLAQFYKLGMKTNNNKSIHRQP